MGGLSVQFGADPAKLLEASARSWCRGDGASEHLHIEDKKAPSSDGDSLSASRKRKSPAADVDKKKSKKETKKEKKKSKKQKKKEKKLDKLKKLLKKGKGKKKESSSSLTFSSSSSSS